MVDPASENEPIDLTAVSVEVVEEVVETVDINSEDAVVGVGTKNEAPASLEEDTTDAKNKKKRTKKPRKRREKQYKEKDLKAADDLLDSILLVDEDDADIDKDQEGGDDATEAPSIYSYINNTQNIADEKAGSCEDLSEKDKQVVVLDLGDDFQDDDSLNVVQHGSVVYNERGSIATDNENYDENIRLESPTESSEKLGNAEAENIEEADINDSKQVGVEETTKMYEDPAPQEEGIDDAEATNISSDHKISSNENLNTGVIYRETQTPGISLTFNPGFKETPSFDLMSTGEVPRSEEASSTSTESKNEQNGSEILEKEDNKSGDLDQEQSHDGDDTIVSNNDEDQPGLAVSPTYPPRGHDISIRKTESEESSTANESYEVSSQEDGQIRVVHKFGDTSERSITSHDEDESSEGTKSSHDSGSSGEEDVVESSKRLLRIVDKRLQLQQGADEVKNLRDEIEQMKDHSSALTEQLRR